MQYAHKLIGIPTSYTINDTNNHHDGPCLTLVLLNCIEYSWDEIDKNSYYNMSTINELQ